MTTLVNDQTDRIFLANDRGLVQCLREIGVNEPTLYRKPTELATADEEAAMAADDAAEAEATEGEAIAEAAEPANAPEGEEPEDDGFGPPADEPAAEPEDDAALEDDNPFDDF
jgi:hypothetical protein